MPNQVISDSEIKNDLINPFKSLNGAKIERINARICIYKEKLYQKDRVIQDKI